MGNEKNLKILLRIQQTDTFFYNSTLIIKFLQYPIQDSIDENLAFRSTEIFRDLDIFVHGHLDGNVWETAELRDR